MMMLQLTTDQAKVHLLQLHLYSQAYIQNGEARASTDVVVYIRNMHVCEQPKQELHIHEF